MKFEINESVKINKNSIILYPDNSFGSTYDDKEPWHFQVSLTAWADLLLNFNKLSNKCVSCEGFVFKASKRIVLKELNISKATDAALLFKSEHIPEYGFEILLESESVYFDNEKRIIAFGDTVSQEALYKFGEGQFVQLRDEKIVAIYIALKEQK